MVKATLLVVVTAVTMMVGAAVHTEARAAAPVQFRLIGLGANSCGGWTAHRADPSPLVSALEAQWVLGFLSGIGYEGASMNNNPLNGVDGEAVRAWIDNYCRANPLVSISEAAQAFDRAHPH